MILIFTRYELYLDGESQEVGFLVGLNELSLIPMHEEELLHNFNGYLPIPSIYDKPVKNAKAFWTSEGLESFEEDIKKVIEAFENHGLFELAKITIKEVNQSILYKDEFQAIIENPIIEKIEFVY